MLRTVAADTANSGAIFRGPSVGCATAKAMIAAAVQRHAEEARTPAMVVDAWTASSSFSRVYFRCAIVGT